MAVLINFKICDNAEECNGVAVCPTGALSWDKKKKSIKIDNNKCINCGLCVPSCMVNAIKVAKTDQEYKELEEEVDKDPRKVSDLYLDRYGAMPILPAFLIAEDKFNLEVLGANKLTAVEAFENEGVMCLLKSILITDLFKGIDVKFRKMEVKDKNFLTTYGIKELPALLFFQDGKLIGKIEGYYENTDVETRKLKGKIDEILAR